jgi:hypothetical protein
VQTCADRASTQGGSRGPSSYEAAASSHLPGWPFTTQTSYEYLTWAQFPLPLNRKSMCYSNVKSPFLYCHYNSSFPKPAFLKVNVNISCMSVVTRTSGRPGKCRWL